ncbi:mammalian ependymin-related protein 1-like [Haliotis rubra]|uniref:mammalian ependymin-related protein 1-like n=1 Tax=Haliotis rubra TaxID=36100 RepID=UPI001EE5F2C5|nr:mammalian ependymin-related protein 1-like [Haliotis rubra]
MSKISLVACVLMAVGALGQLPSPCITPPQFTFRGMEINHVDDVIRRFIIGYDATNKRRVMFEEEREIIPGRQLHEYLVLNNDNVAYDFNMKTKECTKSVPATWRDFGIPPNATFENEYYIGGPGEEVYAQEWSDRIPFRQREAWLGSFTLNGCYPIDSLIIGPEETPNDTVTMRFYDIVDGIPDPNDFIPPPECLQAKWGVSTIPSYW